MCGVKLRLRVPCVQVSRGRLAQVAPVSRHGWRARAHHAGCAHAMGCTAFYDLAQHPVPTHVKGHLGFGRAHRRGRRESRMLQYGRIPPSMGTPTSRCRLMRIPIQARVLHVEEGLWRLASGQAQPTSRVLGRQAVACFLLDIPVVHHEARNELF